MSEYIKRAQVAEMLENADIVTDGEYSGYYTEDVDLDKIPAADVAAVKHGKWVWDPNGMDFGLGAWICSECVCRNNNLGMNSKLNPLMFSGSKYCPNCGAKMDGGEHNGKENL